jgi:hypothetical protein
VTRRKHTLLWNAYLAVRWSIDPVRGDAGLVLGKLSGFLRQAGPMGLGSWSSVIKIVDWAASRSGRFAYLCQVIDEREISGTE